MSTEQTAINPPSDVNLKEIRNIGGKGGSSGPDAALTPSPGRGEREDGSGANTPKTR